MDFAYYSDKGGRNVNEDSVTVFMDDAGFCALLADGLGGQGNGDVASQTAIKTVLEAFKQKRSAHPEDVMNYLQEANGVIRDINQGKNTTMTTMVCMFSDLERLTIAHIGDSRLYHFEEGRLVMQTVDHSVPQMAVALGEIKVEEIRFHPDRNRILRAIGADDVIKPDIRELELNPGFHAFLLCSDGLWEYVTEPEMEADLAKSETAEAWLHYMRNRRDRIAPENADNNTAITIMMNVSATCEEPSDYNDFEEFSDDSYDNTITLYK